MFTVPVWISSLDSSAALMLRSSAMLIAKRASQYGEVICQTK